MNSIAMKKEERLLDGYLCNGLVDSPDTSVARRKQQKGLEVFRDIMLLHTVETMQEINFQHTYVNSFSRCRSRFDEFSRVCLGSRERK
jgi:hypothetical protein